MTTHVNYVDQGYALLFSSLADMKCANGENRRGLSCKSRKRKNIHVQSRAKRKPSEEGREVFRHLWPSEQKTLTRFFYWEKRSAFFLLIAAECS